MGYLGGAILACIGIALVFCVGAVIISAGWVVLSGLLLFF